MSYNSITLRIEDALQHVDKVNLSVSNRGVDWHLEHSLKIIASICNTLVASDPKNYKPKFSLVKYYILWTGKIPRGKARSPKPFNNKEEINRAALAELFTEAKKALENIEGLPEHSHFPHPLFGDLKLSEAKKFIVIHTDHHLKIMEDIIKA